MYWISFTRLCWESCALSVVCARGVRADCARGAGSHTCSTEPRVAMPCSARSAGLSVRCRSTCCTARTTAIVTRQQLRCAWASRRRINGQGVLENVVRIRTANKNGGRALCPSLHF